MIRTDSKLTNFRTGVRRGSGALISGAAFLVVVMIAAPAWSLGLSTPEESAGSLNQQAIELLEAKNFDDAVLLFGRAHAMDPTDDTIRRNLAIARNNRGLYLIDRAECGRAILDFEAAHRLDEDDPLFLIHLGYAHLWRWDLTRAESTLLEAKRRFPAEPKVLDHLGHLYYIKDDLPRAIDTWQARIELSPDTACAARREKAKREHSVSGDFLDRSSNDFTLKFLSSSTNNAVADDVLRMLESARATVCSDLGFFPQQRTIVLLYQNQAEMRAATGAHGWVGGLYDGRIRLPLLDLSRYRETFLSTARHEYTHRVLHELAPSCPIWINEGLAEWFERGGKDMHARIRSLIDAGTDAPAVNSLVGTFATEKDRAKVDLSYAVSSSFAGFLMERYGLGAMRGFLHQLRGGEEVDVAMRKNFGGTVDEVDALWRREVLQK